MAEHEGREAGTEESQIPDSYMQTIVELLAHPNRTMAMLSQSDELRNSTLVVASLTVTAAVLGTLVSIAVADQLTAIYSSISYQWRLDPAEMRRDILITTIPVIVLGIPIGWVSFSALFHTIARLLGGSGTYRTLLGLLGYTATPMVVTNTVLLVVCAVHGLFPNLLGLDMTEGLVLLGWCVAVVWGPGVLSYYALRHGEALSAPKAGVIVATPWALLLVLGGYLIGA